MFWGTILSSHSLSSLRHSVFQHQHTRCREALPITKAIAMALHQLAKVFDNVELGEIFAYEDSIIYKYMLLMSCLS